MVGLEQQGRMVEFMIALLEQSGIYQVQDIRPDLLLFIKEGEHQKESYSLFLHHSKKPVAQFEREVGLQRSRGRITSNLFYKDGEEFHVLLGASARRRESKSLKQHSDEINKIIHLRELEKQAINYQTIGNKHLFYYQPETSRLEENIRCYHMRDVQLDYSHLDGRDQRARYAKEGISIDYKIADEILTLSKGGILFKPIFPHIPEAVIEALPKEVAQVKFVYNPGKSIENLPQIPSNAAQGGQRELRTKFDYLVEHLRMAHRENNPAYLKAVRDAVHRELNALTSRQQIQVEQLSGMQPIRDILKQQYGTQERLF